MITERPSFRISQAWPKRKRNEQSLNEVIPSVSGETPRLNLSSTYFDHPENKTSRTTAESEAEFRVRARTNEGTVSIGQLRIDTKRSESSQSAFLDVSHVAVKPTDQSGKWTSLGNFAKLTELNSINPLQNFTRWVFSISIFAKCFYLVAKSYCQFLAK